MAMKDGIDVRVTPSLDAEPLRALEGYNEQTAPFIAVAVSAFNDAYVTTSKVHDAREAADSNPAWNEEQKLLIVGKEASKQQDRLLRRMDLAMRDLEATIKHTEGLLSQPLEARALGTLNAEIRNHARSLSREDRGKLIREAMDADDDTTLASILAAPPYLSGLTDVDHRHHLHVYNTRRNPHLVDRLTVMRGALDKVDRDGKKVITALQKAVGAPASQVRGIDKADAAARAALKIEPTP